MSKADVAVVEEPVQPLSRRSSILGEQLQVADPEQVSLRDEGNRNPEFKLPKTSSLVVVIMTNVLLQVILRVLPTQRTFC